MYLEDTPVLEWHQRHSIVVRLIVLFCVSTNGHVVFPESKWSSLFCVHRSNFVFRCPCRVLILTLSQANPGLFFFIFVFSIQLSVNVQYQFLPMTGFERWAFGMESDHSTTHTATAHLNLINLDEEVGYKPMAFLFLIRDGQKNCQVRASG